MIVYEVVNIKTHKTHYVAELLNQAEVDIYNQGSLRSLLIGTNIRPEYVTTIVVNKFAQNANVDEIIKNSKPYVIDKPEEFVVNVTKCPLEFKEKPMQVKTVPTPSADHRTTEDIRDDLEKQYREFILLLHRSEMELSSIRKTVEDALHKIQDQKIIEKFHK